ncbi:filamentous hemagglutinin N-terminal domain-containing protein [Marinospirillum minutulum]|uniref:two-partner secretion domain-containing protein n=1 Tax=Marinospirillum minutulum TaxID=64974 RepID=UPI00041BA1D2|nr:filamentous hemagglutinin N-terminal domain-containing protein [Marinospirillum minutulum]
MNNLFKVVWNKNRQVWQAVSEYASSNGKATKASSGTRQGANLSLKNLLSQFAAGSLLIITLPSFALANNLPTGGQVTVGNGQISSKGQNMTINQTSQNMVVDWQSFSIGKDASVNFVQPNTQAAALNRVLGNQVSNIRGALKANGQVFLVNPNGILFSQTARVDVGSLVASTLNISNQNFMNGNYRFEGSSSNAVINQGNIQTLNGGTVAFIAAKIINTGSITTPKGNTLMGAGNKVVLDLGGPVKIEVQASELETYIEQGGAIKADGGTVYLTAKAANALTSSVINHTGITQAQTLASGEDGTIMLMGDMNSGLVQVAGTLDASALNKGNGGFIETSAAKVQINDVKVTTLAKQGKTGTWLIDPVDITIAATGGNITGAALATALQTNNVTLDTSATGSCTGAACDTLTGTNGNIFVNDDIKVTSGNTDTTLTLKADRSITVDSNKEISSTSGKLNLVFWARAGGDQEATDTQAGSVWLKENSSVHSNGGNITIGGGTDPLTGYAKGVAGSAQETRGVTLGGSLDAAGGNINIRGRGKSGTFARGVSINSDIKTNGTGTIDIHGFSSGDSDAVALGDGARTRKDGSISAGTGTISISGKKVTGSNAININNASNITSQGLVVLDGTDGSKGTITSDSTSTIKAKNLLVLNSDTVNLKTATNDIEILSATNVGAIAVADANSIAIGSVDWSGTSYQGIQASGKLELLYGQGSAASGNTSDYSIKAPVDLTAGQNFSTKLGSDGAVVDWTVVTDAAAMQAMTLGDATKNYALGTDLTLTGTDNWTPIGINSDLFSGMFDGLGHTISNLHISDSSKDYIGLFGSTDTTSLIKNIQLSNVDIEGKNYVAGLVGYGRGDVSNVSVQGKVKGNDYIGGILGTSNSGDINQFSNLQHLISNVNVTGVDYTGGLIGSLNMSNLSSSYSVGSVVGNSKVGGLVGSSDSTLSSNLNNIKNSYATGSVSGASEVGGLVGTLTRSKLENSYSSNTVTGSTFTGGLIGEGSPANITNSFYDKETNTAVMGDSALGKTKAQISAALSSVAGWSTHAGGAAVAGYEVTLLPYLTNVTRNADKSGVTTLFAGGMGVDGNAYTISNWNQLQNVGNINVVNKGYYFNLSNNLGTTTDGYTMQVKDGAALANGDQGWNPLGGNVTQFNGNFDGLGHTIDSLYIDRVNHVGLFGYINGGAIIKNIGVTNANVKGTLATGILVGFDTDSVDSGVSISNVFTSGEVTGGSSVGGIVGRFGNAPDYKGTLANSYSTAKVTSTELGSHAGGLVGLALGITINNSYSTAEVSASGKDSRTGGIAGGSPGSTITNSYYDKTTTTGAHDEARYGKTTAELQNAATFEGWDLVVDSSLSTRTPFLAWQDTSKGYKKVWVIGPSNSTGGGTSGGSGTAGGGTTGGSGATGGGTSGGSGSKANNLIASIQQQTSTNARLGSFNAANFDSSTANFSQQTGSLELVEVDESAGNNFANANTNNSGLMQVFVIEGGLNISDLDNSEQ